MRDKDKLIRVYSGDEVTIYMLKGRLDLAGIYAAIQNDSNDSFLRGVPAAVDLYIQESDYKRADEIIKEFTVNKKD
jgi:hypothetical protein